MPDADNPFASALPQLIAIANSHPVFGPKKEAVPDDERWPTYDVIKGTDMVFALWEDASQPQGYNAILVKGYDKLRELYAFLEQPPQSSTQWPWTMTAVKCADANWAEELGDLFQKFFPDLRTH
jgi:hypothetical protein